MSRKYYIHNMFWGYFMAACILYFSFGDMVPKIIIVQILSIISAILFPFSKYLIKNTLLKLTKKDFWKMGTPDNGVPRTKLMSIYNIICFFISIPVGIISLFIEIKKSVSHNNGYLR